MQVAAKVKLFLPLIKPAAPNGLASKFLRTYNDHAGPRQLDATLGPAARPTPNETRTRRRVNRAGPNKASHRKSGGPPEQRAGVRIALSTPLPLQ
jgi:hypothetical protein